MKRVMKEVMILIFMFNWNKLQQKIFVYIYQYMLQRKKKCYCELYRSNSLRIHISRASPGASARKTAALLGMSEKRDASIDWSSTLKPVSSDCAILIAVSRLDSVVNPTCRSESTMELIEPWKPFNSMRF